MRTEPRARWLIALVLALVTLSIATVAGAAGSDGGTNEAGGSSGQISPGSPGDPGAPANPKDDHVRDCGVVHTGPGTGPDVPVSYTPCPGDEEPLPWDDPNAAQPVEPTPGMAGVRARPFDRAIVNDDGTITVLFVSGVEPCSVLDRVVVDYGDGAVRITLFEGHDPVDEDFACIDIAVLKSVTITPDEPLGGRLIVDGAA
jgi:hypothetical protein